MAAGNSLAPKEAQRRAGAQAGGSVSSAPEEVRDPHDTPCSALVQVASRHCYKAVLDTASPFLPAPSLTLAGDRTRARFQSPAWSTRSRSATVRRPQGQEVQWC
jgi:hypothetical protein